MSDDRKPTTIEKLKNPKYGFFGGLIVALLGERGIKYGRKRYGEYRENEMEEFADKVIEKYKKHKEDASVE